MQSIYYHIQSKILYVFFLKVDKKVMYLIIDEHSTFKLNTDIILKTISVGFLPHGGPMQSEFTKKKISTVTLLSYKKKLNKQEIFPLIS